MRHVFIMLLASLLLSGSLAPALAQGELADGTLAPFSAFPNDDPLTKFDLTSIDYTKEVPANYVLGAGDLLVIDLGNIAGDMDQQSISPQGDIFVPAIGKVHAAGLTVDELRNNLDDQMAPYFRNYSLAITVGRVRKIEVQLSGMVNTPGSYIAFGGTSLSHFMQIVSQRFTEEPLNTAVPMAEFVSRTNNRFRALLPEGSYRRVKIYRDGKLFREVDLGKLMIFGMMDQDFLLEHGDRVHIPALEKYVIFDDSVPFSGKIELLPGDTLSQLIKMVGGPENFSVEDTVEVQVGRGWGSEFYAVDTRNDKIVDAVKALAPETGEKPSKKGQDAIDAYIASHEARLAALPAEYRPGNAFKLQGGELVRMPRANDVIYLVGAWVRPGGYGYRADWTVFDYIGQSGGFYPSAQEGEARWIRAGKPGEPPQVTYISLKGVMLGESALPELRPGDMLYVPFRNNQWPGPALFSTLLNFGTQLKIFGQ